MIEIQVIISIVVIAVGMWEQVLLQIFVKELEDQRETFFQVTVVKSRTFQRLRHFHGFFIFSCYF